MEFKKIPAPSPAQQSYVDPDTQMKQNLRLMAKRMLHGTRGLLFLTGSIMLVTGVVGLFYLPQVTGLHVKYWELFPSRLQNSLLWTEEWLVFADFFIALLLLPGGWLVLSFPRFFTLFPAVCLTAKVLTSVSIKLMAGGLPSIPLTLFQFGLTGVLLRTVSEARAYRREVALACEYFRSTAIMRMKEARR